MAPREEQCYNIARWPDKPTVLSFVARANHKSAHSGCGSSLLNMQYNAHISSADPRCRLCSIASIFVCCVPLDFLIQWKHVICIGLHAVKTRKGTTKTPCIHTEETTPSATRTARVSGTNSEQVADSARTLKQLALSH